MELILWRHAEAEVGEPDEDRVLTAKGHKHAWKMAEWLDRNLPNSCKILASPTMRTVQTAEALGRKFKVHADLAPGAAPEKILKIANWPHAREPVLLIGHQPALGQVAALLLAGTVQNWSIRKANAWWIVQRERGDMKDNHLRAVMAPDLFIK
ncbi:MAG: histidine phosphatase family protein [Herminiimonas sp.]|nr:histidine phosphatase family protein [Herminiimonas sp.]